MDEDITKRLFEPLEMTVTPEMEKEIKEIRDFYDDMNRGGILHRSLNQVANAGMILEYLGSLLTHVDSVVPALKSHEDPEYWPEWKKDLAKAQDRKYRVVDTTQGISQS